MTAPDAPVPPATFPLPLDAYLVPEGATMRERPVAFLFPGQGAQYPNMGRDLYDSEPAFRKAIDAWLVLGSGDGSIFENRRKELAARQQRESERMRREARRHWTDRTERAIRRWQAEGAVPADVDPRYAASALGWWNW